MPYRDFYRMQAEAFASLPVLNLFYSSRTHQDGWRYMLRGIAAREPFLFVAGDYGMGKTLLGMMLVRLLKKKCLPLVQITDPLCGFSGILRQISPARNHALRFVPFCHLSIPYFAQTRDDAEDPRPFSEIGSTRSENQLRRSV